MYRTRATLAALGAMLLCALAAAARGPIWEVSPSGELRGLRMPDGTHRTVGLSASLAGCPREGTTFRDPATGASATVTEHLRARGDRVRWSVEVRGTSADWTAPIDLTLAWPASGETRIWAPWGGYPGAVEPTPGWVDPLVPLPLADTQLSYGGTHFARSDTVSLPLVTLLETRAGFGVTLSEAPTDAMLDMVVTTRRDGSITFSHRNHRIGPGRTVRFELELLAHPCDWRAGLADLVTRYPRYFEPHLPLAAELAGCGAYTTYEGQLDVARLAAMGFRVNWKASFDFPYMGMFLPPVGREERWPRFGGGETSVAQLAGYAERMRDQGFHVLSYFNVTEFGAYVQYPAPAASAEVEPAWRDANAFLSREIPGAILPGADGKPLTTWEGGIATDCGDPAYRAFLLEQARRHVEELPATSGICIDRLDWLMFYNRAADDGASWIDGAPARSVLNSWKSLLGDLGPLMHNAGKVIFVNPHYRRLDAMREPDGIYDEFGQIGGSLNACSFLALRKPYIGWTPDASALKPDPDAYFQRNLHMGAFPTAPLPGNDHTIRPDASADPYYLDYGPLLLALTGRTWSLGEASVHAEGGLAKTNLFEIPGGYAVPVTFAGAERSVTLVASGLGAGEGVTRLRCLAIGPGEREWRDLGWVAAGGTRRIEVPLTRGCAMVKLLSTWFEPTDERFMGDSCTVTMGTGVRGAALRYTLDGSEPTPASPRYAGPIRLHARATVRLAAFVDGRRAGDAVSRTYLPTELPEPSIDPPGGPIVGEGLARISQSLPVAGAVVRYTLDGSDPTDRSPAYREPLRLAEGCTLSARTFAPGCRPGPTTRAEFRKSPPAPPLPDAYLSDLTPTRASSGWGGEPRRDTSIQGKPLTVAGVTYARGMGTHAASELAYALTGGEAELVATVGVDDEMSGYSASSIVFEAWCDGTLLTASPVLRLGQPWNLRVALPAAGRELLLRVTDAGDGIQCDHADWASAGFLRRR